MPNELNIALKTGLTVTAQRYQAGAAVGSAISCPETGSTGFYSGNMTGTAGTYQIAFRSASANVGSGSIVWDGTAEVASSAPSVVQIRAEMDSNSTKLANLDATVSSRLAPNGTLATVTTLTNAPTVPTAAAIATQVRTELTTELANLDATVSSRLATSAYTAPTTPPTAVANAAAVRAELATELARVDAAVSSRLAPSGTLATVTTLTNAPASVTPAQIRAEMDSNSTKLANLDTTVSSRLASSAYSAAPTTAQIATAVEGSLLNEADGQAVLNAIVGAIGNTNVSDVALVAAIRTDLERTGGKIDSIPTTAAPTAAANASAVWATASKTITGGTVDTLTNSPSVPSAASIASATRTELAVELARVDVATSTRLASSGYTAPSTAPTAAANASAVRTELATELARVDVATSTRLASSAYTAPANSDVTAIKAKTDLLETTRLAQCSTVATTGAQLAAALS